MEFLVLQYDYVLFLLLVGFVAGMVSGFIGSGGAFVLTPGMMGMGVVANMAVASNLCHKFPKALVATIKRARYGQVDVKLGLIMGLFAEAGVILGKLYMDHVKYLYGKDGVNLYVSVVLIVVLAVVGAWVLVDAWRMKQINVATEKPTAVARWIQSLRIPYTMVYFKSIDAHVSVLFVIPLGFATGMLAGTIAVGGFIGVPAMIYILGVPAVMAAATELLIAFVMGLLGTILYAWSGDVDIRLAMIILAGSLFGVQIGAIGSTYVKPYMVKLVMGVIMLQVLVSRAFYLPGYLSHLNLIDDVQPATIVLLNKVGFVLLCVALVSGAVIIVTALVRGIVEDRAQQALPQAPPVPDSL